MGSCVDKDTGDETPTECGIIHSSKKGAYIVPTLPDIT
ncbi:polymorphic toxin type 50 domain-containing protein [Clostridium tertium]